MTPTEELAWIGGLTAAQRRALLIPKSLTEVSLELAVVIHRAIVTASEAV